MKSVLSSVVERSVHIGKVAGPIPAGRTFGSAPTHYFKIFGSRGADRSVGLVERSVHIGKVTGRKRRRGAVGFELEYEREAIPAVSIKKYFPFTPAAHLKVFFELLIFV